MTENLMISQEKLLQANQSKILAALKKSCYVSDVDVNGRVSEKAYCHLTLFKEKINQMLNGYKFAPQKKANSELVDTLNLYAVLSGVTDPDIALVIYLYKNEINSFYLEFLFT